MRSHLPERIYLSSPVWLQNLLVSYYGAQEHRRRYGGVFKETCQELAKTEFMKRDELTAIVNESLKKILETAISTVPYYKALDISAPELGNFPILERQAIAENSDLFLSNKYNTKGLLTLFTGGSTGTALKVHLTKETRQRTYAFWSRFYNNIGFNIGEKKASFVGRKVQDPQNDTPPFWRYNIIDKQLIFSSFHMSEKNLPLYINKLNEFKPVLIEGYPLSILRLAEFINNNGIKLSFTPKGLSTSSENFTLEQRSLMEKAFNCRVFDQYGSAESVIFASECEFGVKHVSPEYGVLEVLNTSGEIKSEGEGEFIVTTLLNDAMPLIRYKIGDLGKIRLANCKCGRETPIIESLHGKSGAVIVSEGKRVPTAALAIAFEYIEEIKNAQIIQNDANKIIVKLSVKPGFAKEQEDFMRWELQKMLGNNLTIEVQYVDEIPPSPNGKYQMVVQNYYK